MQEETTCRSRRERADVLRTALPSRDLYSIESAGHVLVISIDPVPMRGTVGRHRWIYVCHDPDKGTDRALVRLRSASPPSSPARSIQWVHAPSGFFINGS